ncbi:MAG TPA: riboflavin synthase [Thermoanaerobaculia bacterium]|jgi:riboflavin synthase|nr:riboflavin synthase [Thermoanaerobaculia bacterium]
MFTGIVAGIGRVTNVEKRRGGLRLAIAPPSRFGRLTAGESVAVAGVCLTAVEGGARLVADVSPETLRRSRLGVLAAGDRINLERALRWGDRLSGHFVMGHVDGIVRVETITRAGNSWTYAFSLPRTLARYVATKGSVALDGVSLTIAARHAGSFEVAVIPETHRRTTLGRSKPGDAIHFEADVFARYGRAGALRRVRPRSGQ